MKFRIFSKFLLLVFLLELTACKWFTSAGVPFLKWSNIKIPEGTPTFKMGFKDGCSSTLYSRGNVYYRTRYGYRYDVKLIGNPEYRFGHQRGYTWCFQHIVATQQSFDRHVFGTPEFEMTAGDVNKAWGGMFGSSVGSIIEVNPGNGFDAMFDVWKGSMSGDILRAGGSSGQFFGQ